MNIDLVNSRNFLSMYVLRFSQSVVLLRPTHFDRKSNHRSHYHPAAST